MKFGDIAQSVNEAWDFLLPPVLYLLFGLAILGWIGRRPVLERAFEGARRLRLDAFRSPATYKTLESYGLAKLMPLLALLAAVFALYMTTQVVRAVGSAVPGHVTYRRAVLYAPLIFRPGAESILRRHPSVASAEGFVQALDDDAGRLRIATKEYATSPLASADSWRRQQGEEDAKYGAAKFFAFFCIVANALARRLGARGFGTFLRFALALAVCLATAAVYLFKELYAVDQQAQSQFYAVAAWSDDLVASEPKKWPEVSPDQAARLERSLEAEVRGERWWSLRFLDTDKARWVWRALQPVEGR